MPRFTTIKHFFEHRKKQREIAGIGQSPLQVKNWRLKDSPERPACIPEDSPGIEIKKTEFGVEFVTTPDERFENLPDYNFAPRYEKIDGLNMHYIDEGPRDGKIVLLLHGQPTWSYLYRKMIPVLSRAGCRTIAVDHIGMGRSDKPVDIGIHTYEWHVGNLKKFISQLGLANIVLFCHNWGGLMGLRVAGDTPGLFSGIIASNASLPLFPRGKNPFRVPNPVVIDCAKGVAKKTQGNLSNLKDGEKKPKDFQKWIVSSLTMPNFEAGHIIANKITRKLTADEARAYNAPFPEFIYKAAPRAFPSMVAAVEQNNAVAWNSLGNFSRPFLFLAGELDNGMGASLKNQMKLTEHIPGAKGQPHERFLNAGHFMQEDLGELLAHKVIKFITDNPSVR